MSKPNNRPKLEDSFASAFVVEATVPSSNKKEKESHSKMEDKNDLESVSFATLSSNDTIYPSELETLGPNIKFEKTKPRFECLAILSLPDIVLEKIFTYLPYDQVAQMRVICKR